MLRSGSATSMSGSRPLDVAGRAAPDQKFRNSVLSKKIVFPSKRKIRTTLLNFACRMQRELGADECLPYAREDRVMCLAEAGYIRRPKVAGLDRIGNKENDSIIYLAGERTWLLDPTNMHEMDEWMAWAYGPAPASEKLATRSMTERRCRVRSQSGLPIAANAGLAKKLTGAPRVFFCRRWLHGRLERK